MTELIINLKNYFLTIINNNQFAPFISNIIVSVVTVFLGKIVAGNPSRTAVKHKQFDVVYLPLHRILMNVSDKTNIEDIRIIYLKIHKITNENYELVFPTLHRTVAALKNALDSETNCQNIILKIKNQVSIEYELLKKQLGYPSENTFSLFIRMPRKKKWEFVLGYLNVIWIISFLLGLFTDIMTGSLASTFSYIAFYYHLLMIFLNVFYVLIR